MNLKNIDLVWNTDVLQLVNSKRRCNAWPILCFISNNLLPINVFEVAVAVGEGKPRNTDYLLKYIDELGQLMRDGIVFNNKHIKINHRACNCDAPARAFIKHTVQFSAALGCDQCEQCGVHDAAFPKAARSRASARFCKILRGSAEF